VRQQAAVLHPERPQRGDQALDVVEPPLAREAPALPVPRERDVPRARARGGGQALEPLARARHVPQVQEGQGEVDLRLPALRHVLAGGPLDDEERLHRLRDRPELEEAVRPQVEQPQPGELVPRARRDAAIDQLSGDPVLPVEQQQARGAQARPGDRVRVVVDDGLVEPVLQRGERGAVPSVPGGVEQGVEGHPALLDPGGPRL
jgi:hypothetical protein